MSEYFTVALPFALVVAESFETLPVGDVTVTVTAPPDTGREPLFTDTVIVAERVLPVLLTTADAATARVPSAMLAEPTALDDRPVVPSAAVRLNEYDPVALAGETSENVVDALAPGASDATEAGLNDDAQPLGTDAENVNGDAAQPVLFLFVSVSVY